MCGITGWLSWTRDLSRQEPILATMTQTMACRGPDAEGFWFSPHCAFGHRRLVVVDPAGGAQPMLFERGRERYVLVYNGELYNTADLQAELRARGYTFRGYSDTEALLLSYVEWGPGCLERLNGIFAFAIWNETRQQLFLGRDRLGVKPLFYAHRQGEFFFGSELKAILAHPEIEAELDAEGIAEIFALGPGRTPGHGVFRGLSELLPGRWMIVDRNGIRSGPYWQLRSLPHEEDLPTTIYRVESLLREAVERQLVSDVPVATLLSGGLDSSTITAYTARYFAETGRPPLHTFSVDYVENDRHFRPNSFEPSADGPWARRVARHLDTRHHSVEIGTEELVAALADAVRARDLPGQADIDASLLLFSREIRKEATVALSGECADEIFGGYPWFHREDARQAGTFPWALRLGERVHWLSPELREEIRPVEYVNRRYREALAEVPRLPGESPEEARMREIAYLTLTRWMPVLLDRKDRMTMAAALEVRVPFCDHHLVEYVWNIPWAMKRTGGEAKGILRKALHRSGLLPDEVLWRKKSPYPKTHHPAYTAGVREAMLAILDDPTSPILPFLNRKAVKEVAEGDPGAFDIPWFGQLMRGPQMLAYFVQVDTWLREYGIRVR